MQTQGWVDKSRQVNPAFESMRKGQKGKLSAGVESFHVARSRVLPFLLLLLTRYIANNLRACPICTGSFIWMSLWCTFRPNKKLIAGLWKSFFFWINGGLGSLERILVLIFWKG